MFKDIALSRDLMEEYRESSANVDDRFSAMVLKFSIWPFKNYDGKVGLPPDVMHGDFISRSINSE